MSTLRRTIRTYHYHIDQYKAYFCRSAHQSQVSEEVLDRGEESQDPAVDKHREVPAHVRRKINCKVYFTMEDGRQGRMILGTTEE